MKLALLIVVMFAVACGGDKKFGPYLEVKKWGHDSSNKKNTNETAIKTESTELPNLYTALYESSEIDPETMKSYSFEGNSTSAIVTQNPCQSDAERFYIEIPLSNYPNTQSGDVYVGVTSYGDVGLVVNEEGSVRFVGFICKRRDVSNGVARLEKVIVGSYSTCPFKPLVQANLTLSDGSQVMFRYLDGGNSRGTKFSFCTF